jgi:LysM repeat protein
VRKRQSKVFGLRVIASAAFITVVGSGCHFVSKPLVLRNRPNVPPPALAPSKPGNRIAAKPAVQPVEFDRNIAPPVQPAPKIVKAKIEKVEIIRLDDGSKTSPAAAEKPIIPPEIKTAPLIHTVQKGDSFWTVARQYGVSKEELAACNNMSLNKPLKVGSTLVIPPGGIQGYKPPPIKKHRKVYHKPNKKTSYKSSHSYKKTPKFTYRKPKPSRPVHSSSAAGGSTYTVRSGDSLWKIARRFGTTTSALASANGIDTGSTLKVGTKLVIPGSSKSSSVPKSTPSKYSKSYTSKSAAKKTSVSKSKTSSVSSVSKTKTPKDKKNTKLDNLLDDAENSVNALDNDDSLDDDMLDDDTTLLETDSDDLIEETVNNSKGSESSKAYYTEQVLPDETLEEIAERNGLTVSELLEVNPQIVPGQKIEPFSNINIPKSK